jgi:LuxR family transcriptional regulator, maltose regulon positive regulatory protein
MESDPVAVGATISRADGVLSRPALFERLGTSARVTVLSAPAGSGKTILLRSWISEADLVKQAAWVPVGRDERDPQRFWLSVLRALGHTGPGSGLVQAVSAAPDLDGWALVERLLGDLAVLEDRLWLVVDDLHEIGSTEVLRQLELLVMRAPPALRFVFATRHDLQLGLHRLRLRGDLAEIRSADLRFSLAEAAELMERAGVELPARAVTLLYQRTEGWAAGLRLAALSLAGHPDPARFAVEFSGSERTVAEYLLAEVLERQNEGVRRLLLRTSVLETVNGELADLLTGDHGGERVLQDLEQANAFVASLDAGRSWFRYHQMFADLLQLELRRSAPGEVAGLHQAAAGWLAAHDHPVDAIRHSQAAGDWDLAACLLADHWPCFHLDGKAATVHELLASFPPNVRAADVQLAALAAVDELAHGSLETAERYLELAQGGLASVSDDRLTQAQLLVEIARLMLARNRGDLPAMTEALGRLEELAEVPEAVQCTLGENLRALALIGLDREFWTGQFAEAEQRTELGRELAHRIGRPFLVFSSLAYQSSSEFFRSFERAAEHATRAVELAEQHGWTGEHAAGVACQILSAVLTWQGRLDEAEPWIQRAERTFRGEAHPQRVNGVWVNRAALELARGRNAEALAAIRAAERSFDLLPPNPLVTTLRAFQLFAQVRAGETEAAERALAGFDDDQRDRAEMRVATAVLRLTQDDPAGASAVLAPVLDGSVLLIWPAALIQPFLLEAIARDTLGDSIAAEAALERSLDLAEPDGVLLWFLLHPVPDLLERYTGHRSAHASLVADIQSLLAGTRPAPPDVEFRAPLDPLSDSELRVLRYLPTNLTAPEIARELFVSQNTVKTHMRNLYGKLGTHRRAEAVASGRVLGLLAPSGDGQRRRPSPQAARP